MWLYRNILILALLFSLSSCGFRPVFEKYEGREDLLKKFEAIQVGDILTPLGKDLIYSVRQGLNPFGRSVEKQYKLILDIRNDRSSATILKDSQISRYKIKTIVNYKLVYLHNSKEIDSGLISMSSSYDVVVSEFANYTAEEYSINNNIREISQELRSRLSVLFLNMEKDNENPSS